ncbi:MAG TPA: SLC13 family permease [Steroidobacteraceae bacterium]|jgi:di/tricarboxylate transporter
MTLQQILAFAVIAGTMALFVWGRLRYDLVAGIALLVAVLIGVVPAQRAFSGFSDEIVVIVASALIVSAAVARSGIIEIAIQPVAHHISSAALQVLVLAGAVAILSAFVKNIGALAMMIPIALQMAKRANRSPSILLMPMAFGSLLGGTMTLIGTSPNIIVSRLRGELVGEPFGMFDFTPVGLGLTAAGLVFLVLGYRLLPQDRRGAPALGEAIDIKDYVTEARVKEDSAIAGQTVSELRKHQEVMVTAVVRDKQTAAPLPDMVLQANDIVLLQGEPAALERAVTSSNLELEGENRTTRTEEITNDEIGVIEAVIGPSSLLIGQAAGRLFLHDRFRINLLAVSRSGQRFTERLRDIELRAGDVVVLQGVLTHMPAQLRELGCLPLAARNLRLGRVRRGLIPIAALLAAMVLASTGTLSVGVAFFGAALLTILLGSLPLREAYEAVEWPILIMLGALIPVSEAIRTTGGTDVIAAALSGLAHTLPGYGAVGLMLLAAMMITPFLNNAATVLVMAPIAASFAQKLGYHPDAFLMAVAIGAGCDFLTPIGHQCNTLVMGPGGYRFGDYARLGAPLSLLILLLGVPLIMIVWPLS